MKREVALTASNTQEIEFEYREGDIFYNPEKICGSVV